MEEVTYTNYKKHVPRLRRAMMRYMTENELSLRGMAIRLNISRALAISFMSEEVNPFLKTVLKIDAFFRKQEGYMDNVEEEKKNRLKRVRELLVNYMDKECITGVVMASKIRIKYAPLMRFLSTGEPLTNFVLAKVEKFFKELEERDF